VVAEKLLKDGHNITIFDNFIRRGTELNIPRLKEMKVVRGDIRFYSDFEKIGKVDGIYHCAANPGIKWSIKYPFFDFETNAKGTLNVLEFARKNDACVVYSSTNKVYDGTKINEIPLETISTRYKFRDPNFKGIDENFSVDGHDHSLYGVSKLAGDLLCQEYSYNMGVPTIVNRMSCIAGKWQLGVEDQGWFAWFVYAAKTGQTLNIYGDGKQVRDILDAEDLAELVSIQFKKMDKLKTNVFNVGGGDAKTMSLLECINYLEKRYSTNIKLKFYDWRIADQKVYISDTTKVTRMTGWKPTTNPEQLLDKIIKWLEDENNIRYASP